MSLVLLGAGYFHDAGSDVMTKECEAVEKKAVKKREKEGAEVLGEWTGEGSEVSLTKLPPVAVLNL